MANNNVLNFLRDRLRELRTANGATVTFALATIPMVGFVGAAVDYSHANAVKSAMQAAVDSTALMLSKDASTMTSSQLQTKATSYFNALFTRTDATGVTVNATYTSSGGSLLKVDATGSVKANFMGLMGFSSLKVGVNSQVKWGNIRMRVALVLDTTGSMDDDGKMDALKTATKNLLTTLKGLAATNGDVYVSIIPFSKNVNMGSSNYNANWIDWSEWEGEPPYMATWLASSSNKTTWEQTGPGDDCPLSNSSHGFRCQVNPTNGSSTTSSIPSSGTYKGYICPTIDNGSKIKRLSASYYNGCYTSVASQRTISSGSGASCGSAVNCSCCTAPGSLDTSLI
jgi:Flp pilus assembly protein TadG